METGTGKTYVGTRMMYELHQNLVYINLLLSYLLRLLKKDGEIFNSKIFTPTFC